MEPDEFYPESNVPGIDENAQGEWVDEDGNLLTADQLGQLEALGTTEAQEPAEVPEEEVLNTAGITDPIQLIPIAIAHSRVLQIMYQNRRGDTKLYNIEPHEVGGHQSHPAGYLWALDQNTGTIKSFFLGNLLDVQLLDMTFG